MRIQNVLEKLMEIESALGIDEEDRVRELVLEAHECALRVLTEQMIAERNRLEMPRRVTLMTHPRVASLAAPRLAY